MAQGENTIGITIMTTATKAVNYTDQDIETLAAGYDGAASDEARKEQVSALAEKLGKSEQSIRMKLTNLGLYVKPEPKASDKKARSATREQMVESFATMLNVDPEIKLRGLEKANKTTIAFLVQTFQSLNND